MTNEQFDEFIPDPQVCREFHVTSMTLWRWDNEPSTAPEGWPPAVKMGRRNFRSRKAIEAVKANLVLAAIKRREAQVA
jgi:hypothetical protein